ncbi:fatty acid desaturase [Moraxella sp. ZY210820]|uniref:fatty acid desaturase family protein n=1 Tax=unclassified Moraxella TaxID=2685852 RepID=UPI002731EC9F|nr:fatty acid desaturase [Moraxella sp. ZY210820]WLF83639.1 fatty acid desaturase [Moraxella sp. ZY210820]
MKSHKQIIQQIEWKDLRHLTIWQIAYNVILPYPFVLISWYFASQSQYVLAVLFSYFFFAGAFRQGHDIYHRSLGVSGWKSTLLLYILSALTLTSLHAIGQSHLQHHRNPLGEDDAEGQLSHKTWWQALLGGLSFRYRVYVHGWKLAKKYQRDTGHIMVDSVLVVAMTILTFVTGWEILLYQFCVMFVANALVGVVGVWGMHHDCDDDVVARTERNPIINLLTFNLFYHVEHHLFPAVPTNHLPELAKRLDKIAPEMTQLAVISILQKKQDTDMQKVEL